MLAEAPLTSQGMCKVFPLLFSLTLYLGGFPSAFNRPSAWRRTFTTSHGLAIACPVAPVIAPERMRFLHDVACVQAKARGSRTCYARGHDSCDGGGCRDHVEKYSLQASDNSPQRRFLGIRIANDQLAHGGIQANADAAIHSLSKGGSGQPAARETDELQ